MKSKLLHSILAVTLAIVFQLPALLQLEHSFKKHEDIHICNAKGPVKHFHLKIENHCSFLHQPFTYTFTLLSDIPIPFLKRIYNTIYSISLVKASINSLSFALLRAPPM